MKSINVISKTLAIFGLLLLFTVAGWAGEPISNANDLCYNPPVNGCDKNGLFGFLYNPKCYTTAPIKDIGDTKLSKVHVYINTSNLLTGLLNITGFTGCSVDSNASINHYNNCSISNNGIINILGLNILPKGSVNFNLNTLNANQTRQVSVSHTGGLIGWIANLFSSSGALEATYTKNGKEYAGTIPACSGSSASNLLPNIKVDIADAYDYNKTKTPHYTSYITTKVYHQSAQLEAIYLGSNLLNPKPQHYPGPIPLTIIYNLVDLSGGKTCSTGTVVPLMTTQGGSEPVVSTLEKGNTTASSSSFEAGYYYNGTSYAKRNLKIRYKVFNMNSYFLKNDFNCANSSLNGNVKGLPQCVNLGQKYKEAFGQTAYDQCYTGNGEPCASNNHGKGNAPYDNEYGCYECTMDALGISSQCSLDNFAIRPYAFRVFGPGVLTNAGEDFNITIMAVDKTNYDLNTSGDGTSSVHGVPGYDANVSSLNITSHFYTPTEADKHTMQAQENTNQQVSYCPYPGVFTVVNPNAHFVNGEANVTLNFSETGILSTHVAEKIGHEWAKVDENDTNATQRLIKPTSIMDDENDISQHTLLAFKPYKMVTTAKFGTTNGKNWIYANNIQNLSKAPKMAAFVTYTVKAENKEGNITKNYTATCFPDTSEDAPRVGGLKLNTTVDFFEDMNISISNNAVFTFYTKENNSSYYYVVFGKSIDKNTTNLVRDWISPLSMIDGERNSTEYFNIDRNVSIPLNPIRLTVKDMNGSYPGGLGEQWIGTVLDKNVTFYYGRTYAPRYKFPGSTGTAKIYYQVYCNNDGNKTLLPNGTNTKVGVDSINWYNNAFHTPATDGIVGLVSEKGSQQNVTQTGQTTTSPNAVSLQYNGNNGYPYQTTMENNASSWLIYNPYNAAAKFNTFDVEFYKANTNWTGVQETNTSTDSNASTVTNQRVLW